MMLEDTHPDVVKMADAACKWFDDSKSGAQPRWFSVLGQSGTGKTHVAKRLWSMVKAELKWNNENLNYTPRLIYWPAFIADLRTNQSYSEITDMRRWPFLFLDDIGSERDEKGFAAEQLMTLLGCRANRWTMITSNMTLSQLARAEQRIASRLVRDGSVAVSVNAPDYSLSKALKQ